MRGEARRQTTSEAGVEKWPRRTKRLRGRLCEATDARSRPLRSRDVCHEASPRSDAADAAAAVRRAHHRRCAPHPRRTPAAPPPSLYTGLDKRCYPSPIRLGAERAVHQRERRPSRSARAASIGTPRLNVRGGARRQTTSEGGVETWPPHEAACAASVSSGLEGHNYDRYNNMGVHVPSPSSVRRTVLRTPPSCAPGGAKPWAKLPGATIRRLTSDRLGRGPSLCTLAAAPESRVPTADRGPVDAGPNGHGGGATRECSVTTLAVSRRSRVSRVTTNHCDGHSRVSTTV